MTSDDLDTTSIFLAMKYNLVPLEVKDYLFEIYEDDMDCEERIIELRMVTTDPNTIVDIPNAPLALKNIADHIMMMTLDCM